MALEDLERLADLREKGIINEEEFAKLKKRTLGGTAERRKLPTGLDLLDARLEGGVLSGSVVTINADPLAMPEVFLYKFTEARRTIYVTTERKAEYVQEEMNTMGIRPFDIKFVDIYSHHYLDEYGELRTGGEYEDRRTLDYVLETLKKIRMEEKEANIIFDNFSFFGELEISMSQVHMILNYLYEMTKDLNGLTFLLNHTQTDYFSGLLESGSDVVMRAETVEGDDAIGKRLFIPKLRGGTPPERYIKYSIEEETGIKVETGRLV